MVCLTWPGDTEHRPSPHWSDGTSRCRHTAAPRRPQTGTAPQTEPPAGSEIHNVILFIIFTIILIIIILIMILTWA